MERSPVLDVCRSVRLNARPLRAEEEPVGDEASEVFVHVGSVIDEVRDA